MPRSAGSADAFVSASARPSGKYERKERVGTAHAPRPLFNNPHFCPDVYLYFITLGFCPREGKETESRGSCGLLCGYG